MAASDHTSYPVKNTAYRAYFTVTDVNGNFVASATFNTSSAKAVVSKDGGTPGNSTNSIVTIGSGGYYLDLTATEMNADNVLVLIPVDSNPDLALSITTGAITEMTAGFTSAADLVDLVWAEALSACTSVPAATASTSAALSFLLASLRNKAAQSETTFTLYQDDGTTTIGTATITKTDALITKAELA